MITEPACMFELYRAVLTLNAMPDPDTRFFQIETAWPAYPRRYLDAYNPEAELELPWLPTPHDVTTYLETLQWARGLTRQQRRIVEYRARSYSLSLIAELMHTSLDEIERAHAEAVQAVVAAATLDRQSRSGVFSRRHHCA